MNAPFNQNSIESREVHPEIVFGEEYQNPTYQMPEKFRDEDNINDVSFYFEVKSENEDIPVKTLIKIFENLPLGMTIRFNKEPGRHYVTTIHPRTVSQAKEAIVPALESHGFIKGS